MSQKGEGANALLGLKAKMQGLRDENEGLKDQVDEKTRELMEERKRREEVGFGRNFDDLGISALLTSWVDVSLLQLTNNINIDQNDGMMH